MNNLQRRNDDLFEQNRIRERKQMADNILKKSPNKDKTIDILKDNSELRNSESGISIQNSQKTCNNSSQKLSYDISQLMVDQKLSSVKKIQLINQSNQKSIRLDDIILNDQLSHKNIINQKLVFNNEIFFSMLENKLQNQWTKQQKSITHDQNMQTDPDVSAQMNVKLTSAKEIQTDVQKVNKIQLSPFETYDLLFVKDLVNNLNKDNEILFDNTSDLKIAFLFLHQEHKKLQFKYQKEQRNSCFVDLYKERLEEITNERDKALNIGMKLRDKIEIMTDIMKTAVEQQQLQQAEQDQTIQQLMEENKQLRSVLQIHRDIQSDDVYISSEQRQKKEFLDSSQELDDKNEIDKNTSIENEIENGLMQYEQEFRRNQDDYLIFLKEEQDRQFNQEIDEHKEILSGIYDQKLIQKTQEIEQQLLDSLTKQITEQITQNIQKEMSEHLRDQLREEVKQEIRSQLIEEVTQQVQEQFQSNMQNHSNQTSPQKQPSLQYEELKEDKSDKLSQDEKTKDINISQNEGNEQIITKVEQNDQIQINQLNDSSESDQPYQTLSYDTFKNLQKDDKNDIDFKMMFEDQPLSQEEQELFFQLQQREEGFKDNNQFQEEQKTQEQFDSNDNDQTQKIIFQEFTQEKRNHNQSQGFQGQHVFNNYFSSTQISQDQLSNEQFQGQSRGSQRLESIFHYDSQSFNQVPLHPLINNQVNSYSNNFKSIQGFQGQSSNPSQFNNQIEPSQQIEQLQNNENLNDEIFNNNEGNFEELNQQFNDDYSDFLQGLQETDQRRYSFQSMQNNEPFEIANQIEENQDNNLDQLNNNQQEYNYSLTRCGESIDFLGDQLEKDLFNNQDNIQSPISFLMDDGETLSDIFKLKQSNNSSPKQQSPFKSQQRDFPQNMLDSTNGIRSMLVQIKKLNKENNENTEEENQEREEYKEEEYDYFLDAQQDENMLNNNGYHIIDQAELDQSESKDKDSKSQMNKNNGCLNSEYDEDIENIEDEELREYRYRNMLEDLKESIQSEDDEAKRKNQS